MPFDQLRLSGKLTKSCMFRTGLYKGEEVAVKQFTLPASTHDQFSRAEYLKIMQEFR